MRVKNVFNSNIVVLQSCPGPHIHSTDLRKHLCLTEIPAISVQIIPIKFFLKIVQPKCKCSFYLGFKSHEHKDVHIWNVSAGRIGKVQKMFAPPSAAMQSNTVLGAKMWHIVPLIGNFQKHNTWVC